MCAMHVAVHKLCSLQSDSAPCADDDDDDDAIGASRTTCPSMYWPQGPLGLSLESTLAIGTCTGLQRVVVRNARS